MKTERLLIIVGAFFVMVFGILVALVKPFAEALWHGVEYNPKPLYDPYAVNDPDYDDDGWRNY